MTDPIADMLTRLRNAVHARHTRVDVPASRLKAEIAKILEREGYIQGFKMVDPAEETGALIRIFLKYGPRGEKVLAGISRVSRPGPTCSPAARISTAAGRPSRPVTIFSIQCMP